MKDTLKQSTAVVITFGPFVSNADGVTLKTGLVSAIDHASTGIMLSKNGGTLAVRHATVTASTYDAYGCYKVTLDTTDTGTLGTLRAIYTDATTCLPVWQDFKIVPAMIYDSLVSGSDRLDTNVTHIADQSQTAADLAGNATYGLSVAATDRSLRNRSKTVYVSTTGSSGNPGTLALPFDTYAHAEAALTADNGDTVVMLSGTHGRVTQTKTGIAIQGCGRGNTIISADVAVVGGVVTLLARSSLRDCSITNTCTAAEAPGGNLAALGGCIFSASADDITIERVVTSGGIDGLYAQNSKNMRIYDSTLASGYDGGAISGAGLLAMRCNFISDGTLVPSGSEARGLTFNDAGAAGRIVDCVASCVRGLDINSDPAASGANDTSIGLDLGNVQIVSNSQSIEIINTICKATQFTGGSQGAAIAFRGGGKNHTLTNCELRTTQQGSGSNLHLSSTAGNVDVWGGTYDKSKVSGAQYFTFHDEAPAALVRRTTIATLASQTSFTLTNGSADNSAYLNSAAVFTDQLTALQKSIVPISAYTGSTKTVTLASSPAFTIATGDLVQIVPAGSLAQASIDAIATGGTVDPFTVDKDHTWTFPSKNQTTASNIISELIGFNALLAMDFDDQIPKQTSIASITSATFANIAGTEPTVSSSAPSADRRAAHIMVDATAATAGTYTLSVTVLTADGQTFVRSGRFTVT